MYSYSVTATFPGGESAPSDVVGAQTLSNPAAGNEMLWNYGQSPLVADAYSDAAVAAGGAELGVQFSVQGAGYITGIQFYKGVQNTGPHVGDLWDQYGTPLATATFADESQSGWQQVDFSQPVAVSPGFSYVASYLGTSGYFADDEGYFADGGAGAQGLHTANTAAPANGNGLEMLDGGGFPSSSDGANHWVQPVFYPAAPGADYALWSPTNLTATALSDSAIRLNWDNNSTGATALTVLVSSDNGDTYSALPPLPATQVSCTVTGLNADWPYWFKVIASNPAGESTPTVVAARTPPVPAPTNLTATPVAASEIDLTWTDTSSGKTSFTVQRSPNGTSGWTTLDPPVSPGVTRFPDDNLDQTTLYYYRVFATDAAGTSAFSNVAWAETPYSTPTVAAAAQAAQPTVTGTTDTLSVLGAINGGSESSLTYTWSVVAGPGGAMFSANASNAAKSTTITFAAAGAYTLQATIQNGPLSVTSSVQVTVDQTPTSVTISSAQTTILPGETEQFTATAYDQFGAAMDPPPTFTWSVASGGGSVDGSGTFTAPSTDGSATAKEKGS